MIDRLCPHKAAHTAAIQFLPEFFAPIFAHERFCAPYTDINGLTKAVRCCHSTGSFCRSHPSTALSDLQPSQSRYRLQEYLAHTQSSGDMAAELFWFHVKD